MSSLESKKRPRQFPGGFNGFPFGPGNFPGNFRGNTGPQIVATDPAARAGEFTSGFFQPPGATPTPAAAVPELTPAAAGPQLTLIASGTPAAPTDAPAAPVVFPEAPISPAPDSGFVDGDFSISVPPENSSVELVSEMVDASAAGEAAGLPAASGAAGVPTQTASTNTGGVAFGAIAGVAFLVSLLFIFYKWRRGTLPSSVNRLALKLRPASPDADNMEKGLATSDTVSIRSSATTTSYSKAFNSIKAFVRPSTAEQQTSYVPSISAPTAYSGPQADKLAVPLPLHLAKLQAAGLWTAEGSDTVNAAMAAAAVTTSPMDPKPVVAEPLVHPLRAHTIKTEQGGGAEAKPASWPL